jgi:hypothetical protein
MSGFVVEILSSLSQPAPGLWLADRGGHWIVVSVFEDARVFETEDAARVAAEDYRRISRDTYRIVQQ